MTSRSAETPFGFVVIDWAGSAVKGAPIYDLVRMARSYKIGSSRLHRELQWYANQLKCELADLLGYVLVSLARLGMNLEKFPVKHYVRLSEECVETLCDAGCTANG
jgi:hypothetical protein